VSIDPRRLEATLARLVATPSVNPAFSGGTTDESEVAAVVAEELEAAGLEVERLDAAPGRTSVVGRRPGRGGGRSLLLYAHLDTVGAEGMTDPFRPVVREGRMYGRGAYDMKGGLAACLEAARALGGRELAGDLLVAAVADEEEASLGMERVLRSVRADAAIVTEPTEGELCLAHKGFCWVEVETHGHAAHGSRFEEGVDANLRMGRFLVQLEALERSLRAAPPHPLLGPPSLPAPVLRGGTGTSTYAARCRLEIERRTLPDEAEEQVLAEIREITDRLAAADPSFRASVRPLLSRPAFELPPDAPIAGVVRRAATAVLGHPPAEVGVAYWMDAALLAAAGIPTAVLGPSGAGAHAVEEWVEVESVVRVAEVLVRAAGEWCGWG
jgi:acetylornithine deacetylase